MRILITVFCLIFASALSAEEVRRQMSVSAVGTVSAEPDMARIQIGVQSVGITAAEVLDANSAKMQNILELLSAEGVADKDVQTTQFNISPQWERRKNNAPEVPPKIIGYVVNNSVNVRVRDLPKLGAILDKVTGFGANAIGSIQFDVSNRAELMDQARVTAVKTAKARAEMLAEAAGVKLGDLLLLSEGHASQPRQVFARAEASFAADAVPIAQGELDIRATVTLTYEIE
ncbi:MAG: SIMPL domain-containing protein [Pseudomonadota bacterium]